ncbi:MAG: glutamate--tRNA ligase family protein [Planctomycetota bacterium]
MLGTDRKKLSKRTGDTALSDYQEKGYPREAIVNFLALQGWALDGETDLFTRDDLLAHFDIRNVSKAGAVFDPDKFRWMAGRSTCAARMPKPSRATWPRTPRRRVCPTPRRPARPLAVVPRGHGGRCASASPCMRDFPAAGFFFNPMRKSCTRRESRSGNSAQAERCGGHAERLRRCARGGSPRWRGPGRRHQTLDWRAWGEDPDLFSRCAWR